MGPCWICGQILCICGHADYSWKDPESKTTIIDGVEYVVVGPFEVKDKLALVSGQFDDRED